ncbi:MAG TPA: hypothetical protein DCO86_00970, partial [Spirochaetaceae bacterium]|nr:hypothetical protein [Spirochaetaceae bacterium]
MKKMSCLFAFCMIVLFSCKPTIDMQNDSNASGDGLPLAGISGLVGKDAIMDNSGLKFGDELIPMVVYLDSNNGMLTIVWLDSDSPNFYGVNVQASYVSLDNNTPVQITENVTYVKGQNSLTSRGVFDKNAHNCGSKADLFANEKDRKRAIEDANMIDSGDKDGKFGIEQMVTIDKVLGGADKDAIILVNIRAVDTNMEMSPPLTVNRFAYDAKYSDFLGRG